MATSKKSMPGRGAKGKHQAKLKPQDCTLGLQVVNPKAAGIDIGNEEHWVAVPPAMDGNPVRCFKCFTADLKAMANWLKECGIETVVMQSTGVYWMPAYDILEEAGIKVPEEFSSVDWLTPWAAELRYDEPTALDRTAALAVAESATRWSGALLVTD